MARAPGRRKKRRGRFLPDGAPALLARWAVQTGGITLVTAGMGLAAAFATYHSADPSFNTASRAGDGIHNMLGGPGAYLADGLLQMFGLASWLTILALAAWGGRLLVTGKPLARPRLRLGLLLAALLLAGVGLAAVPVPHWLEDVPGPNGNMGGALGQLLLNSFNRAAALVGLPGIGPVMALAFGSLGILCIAYALGLSRSEWRAVGQSVGDTVNQAGANLEAARDRLRSMSHKQRRAAALRQLESLAGGVEGEEEIDGDALWEHGRRRNPALAPFRTYIVTPGSEEPEEEAVPAFNPEDDSPAPSHPAEAPPRRPAPGAGAGPLPGAPAAPPRREFRLPPLTLLSPGHPSPVPPPGPEDQEHSARQMELVLADYGIRGEIVKVRPGPVVTLYELEPVPGTKTSRVIGLSDDIARSMHLLSVRIAAIPGRSVIGIERPNPHREGVALRDLMASEAFERAPNPLTLILGKDIGGQPVMVDLARMPHLLIAGGSGPGQGVVLDMLLLSLLYRLPPDACRLILIDPPLRKLAVYDRTPHLLAPVISEPGRAVAALKWAIRSMEDRYRAMSQLGVRNIAGYNQRLDEARQKGESLSRTVQTGFDPETGNPVYEDQGLHLQPLPYIVIVIAEVAPLLAAVGKEVEAALQRLSQMARAAGIHLVMATERPAPEVLTEGLKAHFPNRIAFRLGSRIDSRTVLGEAGAEHLLDDGDMLYLAPGSRTIRIHGACVAREEVESVVRYLRSQAEPHYVDGVTEDEPDEAEGVAGPGEPSDGLYQTALALVLQAGQASPSFIQRHLQIGYNQAARIIERLEQDGVISRPNHAGKRDILMRGHEDED